MESKQRTPLALAIEEIKKNGWLNNNDRTVVLSILESLKPKEREMLESAYKKISFFTSAEYFDNNLTQE